MGMEPPEIFVAATLANIEELATAVLILTECLEQAEFLRSRLTRAEVERLLKLLASSLTQLPDNVREVMPELGFDAWQLTLSRIALVGPERDDALWFAIRSQAPATLMWLRNYRSAQPALFSFGPT